MTNTSLILGLFVSSLSVSLEMAFAGPMDELVARSQSSEWTCTYTEMHTIPFTKGNYGKSFNAGIARVGCSDRNGKREMYSVGCVPDAGGGFPPVTDCARQSLNTEKNFAWVPAEKTATPLSDSQLDKNGRRCTPIGAPSKVFLRETDKPENFDAVCVTPISCNPPGSKPQSFAACLPRNKSGEPSSDGKSLDSCPAVVDCINDSFDLKPAQTTEQLAKLQDRSTNGEAAARVSQNSGSANEVTPAGSGHASRRK